jgi:hypothetical protein
MAIGLNNLCAPAFFYLAISILALLAMLFQNIGNESVYCLGSYTCDVSSTTLIFVIKIVYVIFWTWLLNIICKSGFTSIAWFLVLFPFILLFILITSIFWVEFDNPFKMNNIEQISNWNIPFFSAFYHWIMY